MTLKEADEAACKFLPVIYNGITYRRITQTGYKYDPKHGRRGYVQLLDRSGNSVTDADPEYCTVIDFKNKPTEEEQ